MLPTDKRHLLRINGIGKGKVKWSPVTPPRLTEKLMTERLTIPDFSDVNLSVNCRRCAWYLHRRTGLGRCEWRMPHASHRMRLGQTQLARRVECRRER